MCYNPLTNSFFQAMQINQQLNRLDSWFEWNYNLNGTLAIAQLLKAFIENKTPYSDINVENYATKEDNHESLNSVLLLICRLFALLIIKKNKNTSAIKK